MNDYKRESRALARLIAEIQAEPLPEPVWEEAECILLARIDEMERASRVPVAPVRQRGFGAAMAFAAMAAGVALVLSSGAAQTPASAARPSRDVDVAALAAVEGGLDARGLDAGDVVEAKGAPVTMSIPGVARWTLSAGGRAVVKSRADASRGLAAVVTLERGEVLAEVVPAAPSAGIVETFAVESAGTRVAAHGTRFRVTRRDADLVVDLDEGSVAVGPTGHVGPTTGRLLVAPARAAFSLDGGSAARWLPAAPPAAPAPVITAAGERPPAAPSAAPTVLASPIEAPHVGEPAGRRPAAAPAQSAFEPPSAAAAPHGQALDIGGVRAHLARCFASTYGELPEGGSIASTLSVELNDDGSVRAARFDPPLRADFQQCSWFHALSGQHGTVRIPVAFGP